MLLALHTVEIKNITEPIAATAKTSRNNASNHFSKWNPLNWVACTLFWFSGVVSWVVRALPFFCLNVHMLPYRIDFQPNRTSETINEDCLRPCTQANGEREINQWKVSMLNELRLHRLHRWASSSRRYLLTELFKIIIWFLVLFCAHSLSLCISGTYSGQSEGERKVKCYSKFKKATYKHHRA